MERNILELKIIALQNNIDISDVEATLHFDNLDVVMKVLLQKNRNKTIVVFWIAYSYSLF